jgi:hypothetical protein
MLNRRFAFPFSEKFIQNHPEVKVKEGYKLFKLMNIILSVSETDDPDPNSINVQFLNRLFGLWRDNITQVRTLAITFNKEKFDLPLIRDKELLFDWKVIKPDLSAPLITTSASTVLALALQKKRLDLPFEMLPIVLESPNLINNLNVKNSLDKFLGFVNTMGFNDTDLIKHSNVLTKIFQSQGIIAIARVITDDVKDIKHSYVFNNWSYNRLRTGTFSSIGKGSFETEIVQDFTVGQKSKLLTLVGSLAKIANIKIRSIGLTLNKRVVDPFLLARDILGHIRFNLKPTIINFNMWLSAEAFLKTSGIEERLTTTDIRFYRDPVRKIYGLKYKREYYVYHEIDINDEGKSVYEALTNNGAPDEVIFFLFLTSYFLQKSSDRISSVFQFGVGEGSFWVGAREEVTPSTNGNRLIKKVKEFDILQLLEGVPVSSPDKMSFSIPQAGSDFNGDPYIVSVWVVVRDVTNVTINTPVRTFTDDITKLTTAAPVVVEHIFLSEQLTPINTNKKVGNTVFQTFRFFRVLLYYELMRRSLLLQWPEISVRSTSLTSTEYSYLLRLLFYGGVTADNIGKLFLNFEEFEVDDFILKQVKVFQDQFQIKRVKEMMFAAKLLDILSDVKVRFPQSKELMVFITTQKFISSKFTEDNILSQLTGFFKRKEDRTSWKPIEIKRMLHKDGSKIFKDNFVGFPWGTPRPLSNGFFLNLIRVLDPIITKFSEVLVEREFQLFWNGNMANIVSPFLFNTEDPLMINLNKSIKLVRMPP